MFFDLDGVILESSAVKTKAFAELFGHLTADQIKSITEYHLANAGISRFDKFTWVFESLLGKRLSSEQSQELGRRFSKIVLQQILDAPLVLGAKKTLMTLHGKIPLYLVSGTPQEELEFILMKRGLSHFFDGVYGFPHTKPAVVEQRLSYHAIAPECALLVGDGPSDYEAAATTGINFLARDSGEHQKYWQDIKVDVVQDLTRLADRVEALIAEC